MEKKYVELLEERLLEHRYRYYVLDAPVLADSEYDLIEKIYNTECEKEGHTNIMVEHGVDFDMEAPGHKDAANRVNNNMDFHSSWLAEMKPVWDRLGSNKYIKESKE
jgi:hypothetical protein